VTLPRRSTAKERWGQASDLCDYPRGEDSQAKNRKDRGPDPDLKLQDVDQLQTPAGKMFPQRYAIDVFSGDKRTRVRLAEFMNGEDVGVVEI
jgi:hypothetical protein